MTVARVFNKLNHCVIALGERVSGLRLALGEDRPMRGDSAVVDLFEDSVADIEAWLNEMHLQVDNVKQRLAGATMGLERMQPQLWQTLLLCQEKLNQIELQTFELGTHPRITFLIQLGQERSPIWAAWVRGVVEELEQCVARIFEMKQALLECWQEIGERFIYTVLARTHMASALR